MRLVIIAAALLSTPAFAQSVEVGTGDWSRIDPISTPTSLPLGPNGMTLVDRAVSAGKCDAIKLRKGIKMDLPFIAKLGSSGQAERIVIKNINCPEVQQVAASAALSYSKAGLIKPGAAGPGRWYRGTISYSFD